MTIRLPATTPTNARVPLPPEDEEEVVIHIFRPHFGADWQESDYEDDNDQDESDLVRDIVSEHERGANDTTFAPAAPLYWLPVPVEHDRVEDYGVGKLSMCICSFWRNEWVFRRSKANNRRQFISAPPSLTAPC